MKPVHRRSDSENQQNRFPGMRVVEERRIGGNRSRYCLVRVIDPVPGSPSLLVQKEMNKEAATTELEAYSVIGSLPNVVTVVETKEDTNGEVALFFQYCAYGNVEQQVARREILCLSEKEKGAIAQDFICVLTEVHKRHYIHGPITPKHLLITANKEAKLSNFSRSRAVSALCSLPPSTPSQSHSRFRLGRYRETHSSRGAYEQNRELQQLATALVQFLLCDFTAVVTEETVNTLPQCYAALKPVLSAMVTAGGSTSADSTGIEDLMGGTQLNGKLAVEVIEEVLRCSSG